MQHRTLLRGAEAAAGTAKAPLGQQAGADAGGVRLEAAILCRNADALHINKARQEVRICLEDCIVGFD